MSNLIGQQLGNYEIMGVLGKGGMATVYRARQLNIKREVAIKVIRPDLAETRDFARRFEREAETIASLAHPHILNLFDYGQQGDVVYLVMGLLKGGSLADLISKGPLSLEVTSRILDQVASALDYAHGRDIIHRDLKPQNVLLDEQGNASLTDFGLARLVHQATQLTQSGMVMGTPSYMSPEQWQGKVQLDARSDIYALGIMVFEMLTGQLPFMADTPFSMMHMHVNEPPPPLNQMRHDLPPGIELVIDTALAKDRDERFRTAGELAQAFETALTGAIPNLPQSPSKHDTPRPIRPSSRSRVDSTQFASQSPTHGTRSILLGTGIIALIVLLVGGSITVLSSMRSATATPTPIPTSAVVIFPTLPLITLTTLVPPNTTEPPKLTQTPDTSSLTPVPKPSETPIPTSTIAAIIPPTLPATPTPTPTSSQTPAPTATLTPVLTQTAAPSSTATPSGNPTAIAMVSTSSMISVANADQVGEVKTLRGSTDSVLAVAFNPEGTLLASGGADKVIRIWEVATNSVKMLQGHTDTVNSVAFSPDGTLLASASADKTIRLWDVKTGQSKTILPGHTNAVRAVVFSPDGTLLASASADKTIRLWDVKTGQSKAILPGQDAAVGAIAFRPDGTLLASGGADAKIHLWDVKSGQQTGVLPGHADSVTGVAFSPDGILLASTSADKTIRLWDVKTAQLRTTLTGHASAVSGVAFNPDGTLLASSSLDKTIRLWDVKAGTQKATLQGHTSSVTGVVFNRGGTLLASGSEDQTARLWGLPGVLAQPTSPALTSSPCTVSTNKANTVAIRVGPGKNRGLRDYMTPNKPYPVTGQAQAADGSAWWKLKTDDNSEAWVAQADVTAAGDCSHVSVVPTPSLAPTAPVSTCKIARFSIDNPIISAGTQTVIHWAVQGSVSQTINGTSIPASGQMAVGASGIYTLVVTCSGGKTLSASVSLQVLSSGGPSCLPAGSFCSSKIPCCSGRCVVAWLVPLCAK